jgi:hypothetical protein
MAKRNENGVKTMKIESTRNNNGMAESRNNISEIIIEISMKNSAGVWQWRESNNGQYQWSKIMASKMASK